MSISGIRILFLPFLLYIGDYILLTACTFIHISNRSILLNIRIFSRSFRIHQNVCILMLRINKINIWEFLTLLTHLVLCFLCILSLSNSRRHLPNTKVIANLKSKIVSCQHFFLPLQKFKTIKIKPEKTPVPKQVHERNFKDIFKYIWFMKKCNCLYRSLLSAMFFLIDIRSSQFRVNLII